MTASDDRTWRAARIMLAISLFIFVLVALFACHAAQAQGHEGRHGVGHDKWHEGFYSKLQRPGGKGSCCNLTDCVPTQSRMVGERHEVLVDGEWTPVDPEVIQKVTAPDGGAHVCFPKPSSNYPKGTLFCVVLPPEG